MTPFAQRVALVAAGGALALVAPFAAPLSPLLPTPDGALEHALATAALFAAFVAGMAMPRPALFAVVALAAAEGAVRKWIVNDITVFLLKDFLALGLYAAVVPRLRRVELRRTPWVVVPLALLLVLVFVFSTRSASLSQALNGLRSYSMYVPLLWVAPRLLDAPRRVYAFLGLILAIGIVESLLASAQALTGNAWLNASVPGAVPGVAATGDASWIRPTGTFLQTGTLAGSFVLPTLVALALVMRYRRGPLLALGLGALAILSWGVLYTGSRAVFAVLTLAVAVLLVYLLWHRRLGALVGVPLAVLAGYALIALQPIGADGRETRTVEYSFVGPTGVVEEAQLEVGRAAPEPGADLGEVVGAQGGTPGRRLREQLALLLDQRLVGAGTGRMTLGSQYLHPVSDQAAESMYVKIAYELGLPALVLYAVLLATLAAAAAWASFVAFEWRRPAAVVALGAATLIPLLSAVTFALDYPFVAIGYYAFTGCALAWAARQAAPMWLPTSHAAPRAAAFVRASRAQS